MPKVSVVLAAYNSERTIEEAVHSVLAQTFKDLELIIVDDGSTDCTADIVHRIADRRLRYFRQPNQGTAASYNIGVALSRGTYVAILDHDDISLPSRLERQVCYLDRHPGTSLVGSCYQRISESGAPLEIIHVLSEDFDIKRQLFVGNPFGHPTVMYRRDAFLLSGGYRPDYLPALDYDLYRRMPGHFANIPEVLVLYRMGATRQTAILPDKAPCILDELWSNQKLSPFDVVHLARGMWSERRHSELRIKGLRWYLGKVRAVEVNRKKRLGSTLPPRT